MIDQLLETRDILFKIAEELYGECWVVEEAFWGSNTERQLSKLHDKLFNLGWDSEVTPAQEQAAKIIAKKLKLKLDPED